MGTLHRLVAATKLPSSRRPSHSISPLEVAGFEPLVPPWRGQRFSRRSYRTSHALIRKMINRVRLRDPGVRNPVPSAGESAKARHNSDPFNLILRESFIGPVVKLGRARALVCRHF